MRGAFVPTASIACVIRVHKYIRTVPADNKKVMSVVEFRPATGGVAAFGVHDNPYEQRNTAEYFIKQRALFNINDARLFEESSPPNFSEKNSLLNGTPENQTWPPIFAKFVHYEKFPLPFPFSPLFENDDFMIILNGADPYEALYPGEEGRAGMSFMHLLVLPKWRHIYNAVSLVTNDIRKLKAMGVGAANFVADPENRKIIAQRIETQMKRNKAFKPAMEEKLQADIEEFTSLNHAYINMAAQTERFGDKYPGLAFYLHVHPNHSVGYLHLHVIATGMRRNSTDTHDNKNTPLDVIMDVLKSTPLQPAAAYYHSSAHGTNPTSNFDAHGRFTGF